jgi:conjugative relaxase-like TrwC/TraI family protein
MLSIGKLGAGASAADYYLRRRAGCAAEYYTGEGEAAGVWCGRGAQTLGLVGELDEAGELALRELLAGRATDGAALVGPVLRSDPRSRVPTGEVVTAVRAAAAERGVDVAALLGDPGLVEVFGKAQAAVERGHRRVVWPAASMPADQAGALLTAAGLDPALVLRGPRGRDRFSAAMRRLGGRVDVRVSGLDLCLSAPKSVSVLYGLADLDTAAVVRSAHRTAVLAALEHIDRTCTSGFRGHHGGDKQRRVRTDGLIGAAFEHRTSRSNDPQLHTHVVVANLLHGADGKWGAVDTREVYAQARTGGFVYQAVLRGELTRTLGVEWGPVRNGQAEITGVPRDLLRLFSKRRAAIDVELERLGRDDPAAAARATLVTRPPKTALDPETLRERWARDATDAGHDPADLSAALRRIDPPALPDPVDVVERLLATDGLTHKRSTFDRRDVLQGVCEAIPAGTPVTVTDLRELATVVVRDPDVVPVLAEAAIWSRRYSTSELLATETAAQQLAAARAGDQLAIVDPDSVAKVVAAADLSAEQTAMVTRITSSGAGVEVIVGPAGSGKTRALAVARQAWETAGVPVQGAALAAIAARVLEDGAGLPARSLYRLLAAVERQDRNGVGGSLLPPGGVLVVDEAGMVGTRQLASLISLTRAHHTKLVLVGDPHQLPEIEAGGLFAALAGSLPSVSLAGNQRQRAGWERAALAQLRDGDVVAAVTAYRRHGRLRTGQDTTEQIEQLLADYRSARARHGTGQVLVVASSRADARRLNTVVRDAMLTDGTLGETELRVSVADTDRSYRVGEQVMVTANHYPLALLNGTRGTVTSLDPGTGGLTVGFSDGRDIHLPADYLAGGQLGYGYALTAHKAQGMTVEVALLWGSAALTRETGYVAMSRGRTANYLYATWDSLRRDLGGDIDRPRTDATPTVRERRALTRAALVQRLEASAGQRLAGSWRRPSGSAGRGGLAVPHARRPPRGPERDIA